MKQMGGIRRISPIFFGLGSMGSAGGQPALRRCRLDYSKQIMANLAGDAGRGPRKSII